MNYEFSIDERNLNKFINYYHQFLEETNDNRILFSFKSEDFKITIYNSKKVLFQGKSAYNEYALWSKHFGLDVVEPVETSSYVNGYKDKKVIGSDEVGTGDLFGPIVVCAAYVTPKDDAFLDELGVRDSKTLSDKQIKDIGVALVSQIPYHIVVLNNEKFNEMTEKGYNMNKIKAYLHNHAIKKMVSQVKNFDVVILDEFCSKANYFDYLKGEQAYHEIAFHTKAESVHRAVAAASIIARYKFILEMERISKEIGITLPKGSGAPADAIAKVIYLQQGPGIFRRIAKLNFKNFERIIKK